VRAARAGDLEVVGTIVRLRGVPCSQLAPSGAGSNRPRPAGAVLVAASAGSALEEEGPALWRERSPTNIFSSKCFGLAVVECPESRKWRALVFGRLGGMRAGMAVAT